jgi:predicted component of type VI protein secretion system
MASYAYGLIARLGGRPLGCELEDVIDHLEHLLNTRKDYGSFLDGFGLEVTDWMWSANPMVALGEHLCEAIARFEPRVKAPRVELLERDDEEGCPVFRLHGTVGATAVQLRIWLHTPYCTVRVERS